MDSSGWDWHTRVCACVRSCVCVRRANGVGYVAASRLDIPHPKVLTYLPYLPNLRFLVCWKNLGSPFTLPFLLFLYISFPVLLVRAE